jgi:hypothetical protein
VEKLFRCIWFFLTEMRDFIGLAERNKKISSHRAAYFAPTELEFVSIRYFYNYAAPLELRA